MSPVPPAQWCAIERKELLRWGQRGRADDRQPSRSTLRGPYFCTLWNGTIMAGTKPIDLNRSFRQLLNNVTSMDEDRAFEISRAYTNPLEWGAVLERNCVVVLGEAGTGKTTEFELQRDRIIASSGYAFFVCIEELAQRELRNTLTPSEGRLMDEWVEKEAPGFFFLDSLDEAKLKGSSLTTALKCWLRAVGDHQKRARLFVSCRVSDWLARTDLQALLEVFPADSDHGEADPGTGPFVVQLAPLTDKQIHQLANHLGVPDVRAFSAAIAESNAAIFADRPQDIEWLGSYWARHKEIPSLRKVLEFNTQEKLKEKSDRPTQLSQERTRTGAQSLAGVSLFTSRRFFTTPCGHLNISNDAAIDPRAVLGSWSDDEISQLLTRAAFDPATYGRVRFHHRTMREYLAAKWLLGLIDGGLPRRKLEAALFPTTPTGRIVPAHLAATAAWMAIEDSSILKKMLELAPQHLIDEGDPDGLSPETRGEVLRAYVEKFQGRQHSYHRFDRAGLGRFAAAGLSTTINELLSDATVGSDTKATLARLVAEGPVAGCEAVCLGLALDSKQSEHLRIEAIHAVAATGSAADLVRLKNAYLAETIEDYEVVGALVRTLFPGQMTVQDLLSLLERLPRKPSNLTTSLDLVLGHELPSLADRTLRLELVGELIGRVRNEPPKEEWKHLDWLLDPAAKILASVLDGTDGGEPEPEILSHLAFFKEKERDRAYQFVREAVVRNEAVRRQLFWFRAHEKRSPTTKRLPTSYWDIWDYAGLFTLGLDDIEWLANDARTHAEPLGRLLAFDTLLRIDVPDEKRDGHIELLRAIAKTDQRLTKRWVWSQRPPRNPSRQQACYRLMSAVRAKRKEKQEKRNKETFQKHIEQIRDGSAFDMLRLLYGIKGERMRQSWGTVDLDEIRSRYGDGIASAAKTGFRAFWRNAEIEPPHKRKEPQSTPYTYSLALAGIALDVSGGLRVETLDNALKEKAIRLAGWELNRLPAWISNLAASDPTTVSNTMYPTIEADYLTTDATPGSKEVLSKLSGDEHVRAAVLDVLADLVCKRKAGNDDSLAVSLEILLSDLPDRWVKPLAATAQKRCHNAGSNEVAFAVWWVAWSELACREAVDYLQKRLSKTTKSKAYRMITAVLGRLSAWNRRYASLPLSIRSEPQALETLIKIVFPIIRPQDDVEHEGAFWLGEQDHAQEMRNRLVAWLGDLNTAEGESALQRLAEQPSLIAHRDWFLHLAEQARTRHIATKSWSVEQAVEWAARFQARPASMNELFLVALDRLDDIRLFVEGGEYSPRDLFAAGDSDVVEAHFQTFVAAELKNRSLRHYTVAREEEVARLKKPDIRLHNPDCGERPVGVELKIAERWSYAELKDALLKQLVGQYLTDIDANHGVLLLCSFGKKKKWQKAGSGWLNFREVIEELQKEAKAMVSSSPKLEKLEVLGIDFH